MKKCIPIIAGALLGVLFIMSAVVILFNLVKAPPLPEGSPAAMFMGALAPTGYLTFIKVIELLGGIFVAIPRTRNLGLLFLGPIIVNILAFHIFISKGQGVFGIPLVISLVSLYLLWVERRAWAALFARARSASPPSVPPQS
jgi:putative oxidoreductase